MVYVGFLPDYYLTYVISVFVSTLYLDGPGDEDVNVLGLDYYLTQYTGPCPFGPKIASEARNQPEDPAGLP